MKLRTVKKAIRAMARGKRTPLMKQVRLDNISEVINLSERKYKRHHEHTTVPSVESKCGKFGPN